MIAEVRLWGRTIGAVSMEDGQNHATFEFTPEFVDSGIELSPITMPLSRQIYEFPDRPRRTFHGLPGLLADSLPDRFGKALIDAWLATEGRSPEALVQSSDFATPEPEVWVRWNTLQCSDRNQGTRRRSTSTRW